MIPIVLSHHRIAWLASRVRRESPSATFIVKGTYDLSPGKVATPSGEQLDPSGDLFVDDNYRALLHYASDFAPFKPNCDILLKAHAHAPEGKPVPQLDAGFQIGPCSKSLSLTGDREKSSKLFSSTGNPSPFHKMELDYSRAYGGPSFPENPLGKGIDTTTNEEGKKILSLPNIHYPSKIDSSFKEPFPAGFGPIPATWPQRKSKMGSYNKDWLKKHWPWFPEDFDWTYFNAAPADQQIGTYLKGNEPVHLHNLHPDHPTYTFTLPSVRLRCLHGEALGARVVFREVPMNLDTVWINVEEEKLVLVWRGLSDITSDTLPEKDCVLVETESLEKEPKPLSEYQKEANEALASMRDEEKARIESELQEEGRIALAARILPEEEEPEEEEPEPEEEPAPPMPPEVIKMQEMAASLPPSPPLPEDLPGMEIPEEEEEESIEEEEEKLPIEEAPEAEPIDRAWCLQRIENGEDLADLDLTGVDLSGANLEGVLFRNSILTDADLRQSSLAKSDLTGTVLQKADLTQCNLQEANLSGADCTGAKMAGANLNHSTLDDADFSYALLRKATFLAAKGEQVIFSHAILSYADLSGASFPEAMAQHSTLHHLVLEKANLENAILESAWGRNIQAEKANLKGLRASGANFESGNFRGCSAQESVWEEGRFFRINFFGAQLDEADFTSAQVKEAKFTGASLRESRFVETSLEKADLVKTNLFRASLAGADLTSADVSRSNLFEADLLNIKTEDARFFESNLERTVRKK